MYSRYIYIFCMKSAKTSQLLFSQNPLSRWLLWCTAHVFSWSFSHRYISCLSNEYCSRISALIGWFTDLGRCWAELACVSALSCWTGCWLRSWVTSAWAAYLSCLSLLWCPAIWFPIQFNQMMAGITAKGRGLRRLQFGRDVEIDFASQKLKSCIIKNMDTGKGKQLNLIFAVNLSC